MADQEEVIDYNTPSGKAAKWRREIDAAKKEVGRFHESSEKALTAYQDKRDAADDNESRINLFWSNVQVLKATLYARPPKADVSRAHKDANDDVARVAGEMLERILNSDIELDGTPFVASVQQGIEDRLIVGLGQIWLRYEAEIGRFTMDGEPAPEDEEGEGDQADEAEEAGQVEGPGPDGSPQHEIVERITREEAVTEYVHWRDLLWSPCRTWQECRWVARRVHMSREALSKRFGKKVADLVQLQNRKTDDGPQHGPWATAEVYEIWCRESRTVYWYADGVGQLLDERPDPLGLRTFWPCPRPLLANVTTSNLMPRSDYAMAQDLYNAINLAQTRIKYLVDACKVRGAYDRSAAPALQSILDRGDENLLIPVDNWALFGEKGGIRGVLDWVPIDMVVAVIGQLREEIASKKAELFEVLGLADIMRGASDAGETATAQQIKAQYGSTRLQFHQSEIANWIGEALNIRAEIICRHFQPETIVQRSNIMASPDAQLVEQAMQLLKDPTALMYRVTVEPDSMAQMDWNREREAATGLVGAISEFMASMLPAVQAQPLLLPMAMEMLRFVVSKFRAGKQLEAVIDQTADQLKAAAQQPKQPDPKAEAEVRKINADADAKTAQAAKTTAEVALSGAAPGLPPAMPMEMVQ